MTSTTVKNITVTEVEMAKIITAAVTVFCKGVADRLCSKEEIDEIYRATLESIQEEDLHGEFLDQFDNLATLLPEVEYQPNGILDKFKPKEQEEIKVSWNE